MSGITSKEEDEDQWISGEELRTEGSSDEDACEPRVTRKKQKTDVLLKRLLVTSLAFPPAHTRLPDLDKTNRVVRPPPRHYPKEVDGQTADESDAGRRDAPPTNFSRDASEDEPKSLQECLRRSLKMDLSKHHRYESGETKSPNHLILEMNEFYFEMVDRLRFLRSNLHGQQGESEDEGGGAWSFETFDQRFWSVLAEIERDEAKYQQDVRMLNREKKERKAILREICESGDRTNRDVQVKAEPQKNDADAENVPERKRAEIKGEKDFVAKNKKLAKEYAGMSRYCLTDEEKFKLESLLSDLEEGVQDGQRETESDTRGGFELDADDKKTLEELEFKLETLSETSGARGEVDDLSAAENLGKHWKYDLMQSRLKTIDKDLCAIQDEKDKESAISQLEDQKCEAEYRKCLADLCFDFNGESDEEERDGDREDYEECLSQIGLKIEEARKG